MDEGRRRRERAVLEDATDAAAWVRWRAAQAQFRGEDRSSALRELDRRAEAWVNARLRFARVRLRIERDYSSPNVGSRARRSWALHARLRAEEARRWRMVRRFIVSCVRAGGVALPSLLEEGDRRPEETARAFALRRFAVAVVQRQGAVSAAIAELPDGPGSFGEPVVGITGAVSLPLDEREAGELLHHALRRPSALAERGQCTHAECTGSVNVFDSYVVAAVSVEVGSRAAFESNVLGTVFLACGPGHLRAVVAGVRRLGADRVLVAPMVRPGVRTAFEQAWSRRPARGGMLPAEPARCEHGRPLLGTLCCCDHGRADSQSCPACRRRLASGRPPEDNADP